jgi:hypothetical protein
MKGMVNKARFEDIQVLAPTPDEQRQFGRIFAEYTALRQSAEERHSESQLFFQSLQSKAFRGDLV